MQIFFAEHRAGEFPDGRKELQVIFTDKKGRPYRGNYGREYTWTPCWEDLRLIFLLAYTVERLNRGQHFEHLIQVAEEVCSHYEKFIKNPKPGHDNWGFKEAPR